MNTLYPIFLKPSKLKLLIVGGGPIGFEKLFFILKNSPDIKVEIVAINFCTELLILMDNNKDSVSFKKKSFEKKDLYGKNLVIAATNDNDLLELLNLQMKQIFW